MSTTINILGYKWTPQKRVRPWALAGPILILAICLPLLRPLRHPAEIGEHEAARLATVEAIVTHRTLAIDASSIPVPASESIAVDNHHYAGQPATMAMLLAGGYWLLTKFGLSFAENGPAVSYILTLLGVTLPVAAAAGLVYRMARQFELKRPRRAGLGFASVAGTGMISYGTVLNPHAPAAVLILCAAACFIHVAGTRTPRETSPWLIVAGFCTALASALDVSAVVFLAFFIPVILALRWPMGLRFSGLLLYGIGAVAPLMLHAAVTIPITGDLLPGDLHPELRVAQPPPKVTPLPGDDDEEPITWLDTVRKYGVRILAALAGDHGLLSHFPILGLGAIGVFKIMHRHWPSATKNLAGATLAAAALIVGVLAVKSPDWKTTTADAMFGMRWFILFSPLLLFWAGTWLRKPHQPVGWTLVGVALGFSVIASLLGASLPEPRDGYRGYTVVEAAKNLVSEDSTGLRETVASRR
jgi:hypothetical protein